MPSNIPVATLVSESEINNSSGPVLIANVLQPSNHRIHPPDIELGSTNEVIMIEDVLSYRQTIKIITLLDIFFSFISSLLNPIFFIGMLFPIIGYLGIKFYNVYLLLTYLFFLSLENFARITSSFLLLFIKIGDIPIYINYIRLVTSFLLLIYNVYVIYIILKFVGLYDKLSDESRRIIKHKKQAIFRFYFI